MEIANNVKLNKVNWQPLMGGTSSVSLAKG